MEGYPAALDAPRNETADAAKCANPEPPDGKQALCNSKRAQACPLDRCCECCVQWGVAQFRLGYDPLNQCATHTVNIERRILSIIRTYPDGIVGVPGPDPPAPPPAPAVAAVALMPQDDQPPPLPQVPPAQPQLRPGPANPAPIIQRRARAIGQLAEPVVRLPNALPADNLATLFEAPAITRQKRLINLNRLGREADSAKAQRTIKAFWWCNDVRPWISASILN